MNKATWEHAKQVLGRASDPEWLVGKGQWEGSSRGLGRKNELGQMGWGPCQGVLKRRLRSLNLFLGPRELLTKVSEVVVGWGSAGGC